LEVIPVLDLLNGVVVHAVGGRRSEYRPVQSLLTQDPDPQAVRDALVDRFGFSVFYVAELNGLMNGRPDLESLANLLRPDVKFIVDAGAATADQAKAIADLGADWIVAASESLRSQRELEKMIEGIGTDRLVFSLDMREGVPIVADGFGMESGATGFASARIAEAAESPGTGEASATLRSGDEYLHVQLITKSVAELGVTRFILLDLADVGESRGMSTLPLLRSLRQRQQECWFAVGGGVRNQADLDAAEQAGADAVLMASAIHNGQFPITNERRS